MFKSYSYLLLSKYRNQLMGIAILWVMFYHSSFQLTPDSFLYQIKRIGYGGVDIFLMLSGLGLYYAYNKYNNWMLFYKKRFLRIIPTYLPVVFIFGILFYLIHKITLSNFIMNLTTLSFWFNSKGRFDWYVPALLVFYLATPLFFWFFARKNKYFVVISVGLFGILLGTLLAVTRFDYLLIFTTRIPIFFIGFLMGYWINTGKKVTKIHYISHFIMLFLGFFILYFNLDHLTEYLYYKGGIGWYPFILITIPLCMLLALIFDYITIKTKYKFIFFTFCGTHSLEIYLFHERIIVLGSSLLRYLKLYDNKFIANLIFIIIALFMAFLWKKVVNFSMNKLKQIKNKYVAKANI